MLPHMENRSMSDVGGTPGGLGEFVIGFVMSCVGGYFSPTRSALSVRIGTSTVQTHLESRLSRCCLVSAFCSGRVEKHQVGWFLTAAGALFILAGVIANMHIYFQPTSLFNTIVMLVLLDGGLGFIARSIVPHHAKSGE